MADPVYDHVMDLRGILMIRGDEGENNISRKKESGFQWWGGSDRFRLAVASHSVMVRGSATFFSIFIAVISVQFSDQVLSPNNKKLEWIVGSWRSEFSGKVFWPTVPTMTFGEELNIGEAPIAKSIKRCNYSDR
ncbi:hypothetical protein COOONC_15213 [Cooperia oncophora]